MTNLNKLAHKPTNSPINSPAHSQLVDALQDRFGLKVTARLNEQALPHDISERLRVARQQAIARRPKSSVTASQTAPSITMSGGAAALGGGFNDNGVSWFNRIASALPLLALVAGLMAVNSFVNDQAANDVASVDVQLLTDDLPPDAHTDPGFAQFLKFGPPQP
jgi:Protein of unknown function (DUF3619)